MALYSNFVFKFSCHMLPHALDAIIQWSCHTKLQLIISLFMGWLTVPAYRTKYKHDCIDCNTARCIWYYIVKLNASFKAIGQTQSIKCRR